MAQYKGIKTYSKKQDKEFGSKTNRVKATSVIDALFAVNITKRNLSSSNKRNKYSKLQLKSLPPRSTATAFNNDSFHCELNDTFDKLFKDTGSTNKPALINNHVNSDSWESDYSDKVTKETNKLNRETKTDKVSAQKNPTRSYKNRQILKRKFGREPFLKVHKHLEEPIEESLYVEKVGNGKTDKNCTKSDHSSVINVTKKFTCNDLSIQANVTNVQQQNFFQPLLKNKFLCSTPNLIDNRIIAQNSVSPIKVFLSKSKVNSRTLSALHESFEEISDWEKRFPFETPKKKKRKSCNKKKLLNFSKKSEKQKNNCSKSKDEKKKTSKSKKSFIRAGTPETSLDFIGFSKEEIEDADLSDHSNAFIRKTPLSSTKKVYSNPRKSLKTTENLHILDNSASLFGSPETTNSSPSEKIETSSPIESSDKCESNENVSPTNALYNVKADPKFQQNPVVKLSNVVDILGINARISMPLPIEDKKTFKKELLVDITLLPDGKLQQYLRSQEAKAKENNCQSISSHSNNSEKEVETSEYPTSDCSDLSEEDKNDLLSLNASNGDEKETSSNCEANFTENECVNIEVSSKSVTLQFTPFPSPISDKQNASIKIHDHKESTNTVKQTLDDCFVTLTRGSNSKNASLAELTTAGNTDADSCLITENVSPTGNPHEHLSKTTKVDEIQHFMKHKTDQCKEGNVSHDSNKHYSLVFKQNENKSGFNHSIHSYSSPSNNSTKQRKADIICTLLNTSEIIEHVTKADEENEKDILELTPENIKKRISDRFVNLIRRKHRRIFSVSPQKNSIIESVLQSSAENSTNTSPLTATTSGNCSDSSSLVSPAENSLENASPSTRVTTSTDVTPQRRNSFTKPIILRKPAKTKASLIESIVQTPPLKETANSPSLTKLTGNCNGIPQESLNAAPQRTNSIIETILQSPQAARNDILPRRPSPTKPRILRSYKPVSNAPIRKNSVIDSILQTPPVTDSNALPRRRTLTKPRMLRSRKQVPYSSPPERKKSIIEDIIQTSAAAKTAQIALTQKIRNEIQENAKLAVTRRLSPQVAEKTRFVIPPPPPKNKQNLLLKLRECSPISEDSQVSKRESRTEPCNASFGEPKELFLKPGKSYRRSLCLSRRSILLDESANSDNASCTFRNSKRFCPYRSSVRIIPEADAINSPKEPPLLVQYATNGYLSAQANVDVVSTLEDQLSELDFGTKKKRKAKLSAKGLVLLRCRQTVVLPFTTCYTVKYLHDCRKIGEGVYGEVFLVNDPDGKSTVMKVIPIEGDLMVNGERQKKFDEILSEIVIATELSALRFNKDNKTDGFNEVRNVRCVRGKYPYRMIQLWDEYDEMKKSENDHPSCFDKDQLFIVLELANGGKDLESFVFNNAEQALSLFYQVACTLAVGERALEFEHRDMHWGNILIDHTCKKEMEFWLNGQAIKLNTGGVQVSIIDFTLSRIKHDGCSIFNDLSLDPELFQSHGDYQFDVYRLMQKRVKNKWKVFEPYTNILWLNYTLDKMITQLRYKKTSSKVHSEGLEQLKMLKDEILNFTSAVDFVKYKFLQ